MKKIVLLVCVCSLFFYGIKAQNMPDAFSLVRTEIDSMHFYDALKNLRTNFSYYQTERAEQSVYFQALATIYAFNSMPDSAITAHDQGLTRGILKTGSRPADTTHFENYLAVPAQSYILKQADTARILMINEAHHVPQHRAFTKSLLKGLYEQGYKALCLEALTEGTRGDKLEDGYYTKEVWMWDLIREARRIGYSIYGYEPLNATNRDSVMAVNIGRILDQMPNAKLLIHAGYGHIAKDSPSSLYTYLKQLTGIAPLTLSQTLFYAHPVEYYASPYYTAFCKHFGTTETAVLVDSMFHPVLKSKSTDIEVFSSPSRYLHGRPAWIFELGNRTAIPIKVSQPSIIKAFYKEELTSNKKSMPVDLLTIEKNDSDICYLALPQGNFIIQYLDLEGNIYREFDYQVE
jgi:hypothetical protein